MEYNADTNIQDEQGNTAIFYLCLHKRNVHNELHSKLSSETIIRKRRQSYISNNKGQNAVDVAVKELKELIVAYSGMNEYILK